ncbi:glutamine ABC transporter substrate-binding protein [Rhodobacteraceae bacterium 63075]|nr:glutamine ABC transporter substrate-binding protein [Rhodobacteraceae bacterium 63075]
MTRYFAALALALMAACLSCGAAMAQDRPLTFMTIERPPFAMEDETGGWSGFSIELMEAIAIELGREVRFTEADVFPGMIDAVTAGRVDGAVANISITAAREETLDFSHPIFESGLQIMLPVGDTGAGLINAIVTRDIAFFLLSAFGLLFVFGMLMWAFERNRQAYFQRPWYDALFPSFWWALNLVVNGGFEERMPQSRFGRFFAVLLVVSSLFIVSVFVAKITATMTVAAISENVDSLNDLEDRRTATTAGSTGEALLELRDIPHESYASFEALLRDFENGEVEAVLFDGPLLNWYLMDEGKGQGRLVSRVFKRENYGIALPTGSGLTEDINRALLALRESGAHEDIAKRYFGN